jgi:hypothetical protein
MTGTLNLTLGETGPLIIGCWTKRGFEPFSGSGVGAGSVLNRRGE